MADWFNTLKNAIMGQEEDYDDGSYQEENAYEEEPAVNYAEEQQEERSFGFAKIKSFGLGSKRTADGATAPSPRYSSYSSDNYSRYGSSSNKVVNLNANLTIQVVITSPTSLEEAAEITEELKDRKTIIVNLEGIDKDLAQRITDFFCGASYALNGSVQPVSQRIIIIGPYGVAITGQLREELEAASGIKLSGPSNWR